MKEALREAARIARIPKVGAGWGFIVLGATRDLASVQKAYRSLMKLLHPDKLQSCPQAACAVQLVREAKQQCERNLSKLMAPGPVSNLRYTAISMTPGSRRFQVSWTPPESRELAPVKKYVVSVFDPAYGKDLTVQVMEPDYSEEQRRFVPVDELTTFELLEADLAKMIVLWRQPTAKLQVAAANEAGRSEAKEVSIALTVCAAQQSHRQSNRWTPPAQADGDDFAEDLQRYLQTSPSGRELRNWLGRQTKAPLIRHLLRKGGKAEGSKPELVERIAASLGV